VKMFDFQFHLKKLLLTNFYILIGNSKYVMWFTLLDILSIHWKLKTENSWWSGIRELLFKSLK
jgi:hypothetical protein